jgi:hypothetical protein
VNHLSTKFRLAAVVALFACASAANAADFTFNVPVSLKSILPADVPGSVMCHVYSVVPPPGLGNIPGGATSIGMGSKPFTLSKGGYSGTVTVAVNADPGKDPANVRGYICALSLGGTNCNVGVDSQPCRGATAAGNSVEVKGEIRR